VPVPGLEDFYRWDGPRPEVVVGERRFCLPVHYHDDEFMASLHTAAYDAVAAELPSDAIRPARWRDGRALVSVAAFRYNAVSVQDGHGAAAWLTPYAEVSVAAVVTLGPAPRVLPVLHPRLHVFVLQLPVTTLEARDVGTLWGFPKFVADMDFVEQPGARQVTVAEDDEVVLRLTVRPSGVALPDHHPHVCYTARDGRLVETVVPMSGYRQIRLGRGAGRLVLGTHPVAQRLARLDISAEPLAVFNYLTHRTILPAGRDIAASGSYQGYPGGERPLGRYTVRYPGASALDVYARPEQYTAPRPRHAPVPGTTATAGRPR
jgi:hypothetical protein